MGNILVLVLVYLLGISILLLLNELIYRRLKTKGESTRKFAHFTATLAAVPFPYIFPSHWYVLGLACIFATFLYITWRIRQLGSIHAIERKSWGSYLLPLSIYITFLISDLCGNKFIYILPMLILAICDPIAALLGMNVKKNRKINIAGKPIGKTWIGSIAFFFSSFIISLIALYIHSEIFDLKIVWLAALVALTGTFAELIAWRGADNLTIPLSIVLILVLFL